MDQVGDFLGAVKTQLDRSQLAYSAYLKSGKIFLYAKVLRETNDTLRDLLISNVHLLPAEHSTNALALLHHIEVWSAIWQDTFAATNPTLTSVFVFENTVNFPRNEVASLMEYYEKNFLTFRAPSR